MSNEFLVRNNSNNNTPSVRMKSSSSSSVSPHHASAIRFDQPIGHDFTSKQILIADLAIRSTAYRHHIHKQQPPQQQQPALVKNTTSIPPITSPKEEEDAKARRRVTFNLDDIQIQTIPAYDSASSCSSSEISYIEKEEEEEKEQVVVQQVALPSPASLPLKQQEQQNQLLIQEPKEQEPNLPYIQPQSSPTITSERISKKESYDALQKRKQFRRDHFKIMNKPGYWYPLAASPVNNNKSIRHQQPSLRSLELTEKLINESIQRELKLNPNLQYTPPSPSPSPPHEDSCDEKKKDEIEVTPVELIKKTDQRIVSLLIVDTDDEEEEEEPTKTAIVTTTATVTTIATATTTTTTTTTSVSSEDSNEEEEEEEDSVTTTTDFTSSVYNELAKRNIQQEIIVPFKEYQPPCLTFSSSFNQPIIPVSTAAAAALTSTTAEEAEKQGEQNHLIPSPPPSPSPILDDDTSSVVWIDHPSLLINRQNANERKGLFFVKVLKAESLDFPIDQTNIYCSIQHKGLKSKSNKQIMSHTMQIKHEMRIDDVDPDQPIIISIHVDNKTSNNSTTNWLNRRISSSSKSDLDRYVSEKDGSICQTLFSPSRFIIEGSLDQTATLMLVNHWYKPSQESKRSSILSIKKRLSQQQKSASAAVATAMMIEKAVGKIYIQCLYVTAQIRAGDSSCRLPKTMDEAIEALNTKRFHQTIWQSGYLGQCGGNTKTLKRRYFTLTGDNLIAHHFENNTSTPLYKIPLSRATQLIYGCDDDLHSQSSTTKDSAALLNQLDSVMLQQQRQQQHENSSSEEEDEEADELAITKRFQLDFETGEKIQFYCESIEELNRWISVLQVMICKLPKLPDWIIV